MKLRLAPRIGLFAAFVFHGAAALCQGRWVDDEAVLFSRQVQLKAGLGIGLLSAEAGDLLGVGTGAGPVIGSFTTGMVSGQGYMAQLSLRPRVFMAVCYTEVRKLRPNFQARETGQAAQAVRLSMAAPAALRTAASFRLTAPV